MTLHKLDRDDVVFIEFDRNFNFIPDYFLLDVVACLRNKKNCSPCRMYFLRDGIVNSLTEQ
jgi:hypothetical protein